MAMTTSPMEYTAETETAVAAAPTRGFFGRVLDRFIQARMKHAEAQVQGVLAQLSDDRLKDLGFSADEMKALREKGRIPASYWG